MTFTEILRLEAGETVATLGNNSAIITRGARAIIFLRQVSGVWEQTLALQEKTQALEFVLGATTYLVYVQPDLTVSVLQGTP